MSLAVGDRLGPYEVLSALGAGGMGEVYRARDATLKRDVALKILPDGFALDEERLARFKREAQVLASLNHSNIAAIYGFEESNSSTGSGHAVRALVLELVEGPTLADRIGLGPIPVNEAIPIARQIAEALEAAHEQGIVHRDLKPANVKLRPDGTVKVLDFGLAKSLEPIAGRSGDAATPPTITSPAMTAMGIILGTAAYMSPEQAKGQPADKRSDVWAFGALLYEMLSGRRAFSGDDVSDTLALVLRGEPDWSALPPATPRSLQMLLKRCLTRDRRARLADMSVVRYILSDDTEQAEPAPAQPSPRRPLWSRAIGPGVAAIVAGALTGSIVYLATPTRAPEITRFRLSATDGTRLSLDAQSRDLAITRDGRRVIFKGDRGTGRDVQLSRLLVQSLDSLEPTPLVSAGRPRAPFSSPDGQWVGFVDVGGTLSLKKVAVTGGPAIPICTLDGASRGFTWGDDDHIIFGTAAPTGLHRVSAAGGNPTVLTTPNRERGEADHLWPQLLPGGRAVLFTITSTTQGQEASQIAILELPAGTPRILIPGGSQAQYVQSGHLVYAAAGTLRAIPFNLKRLETVGTAVPVIPEVATLSNGTAEFDVAADGTLIYVAGGMNFAPPRNLVWVDRQGLETAVPGAPARSYLSPRLSPDNLRVAVDIRDQQDDIWVWEFARRTLTKVTSSPGIDQTPLWMPDGLRLVFASQAEAGASMWFLARQAADGTGPVDRLTKNANAQRPESVTNNGTIVYTEANSPSLADIMTLTPGADTGVPLVRGPSTERSGEVSPDGRWLAYESNEAGPESEIYVRPFASAQSARHTVSTGGGTQPVWARDGTELFYLAPNGTLMSVGVKKGDTWAAAPAIEVFPGPSYYRGSGPYSARSYDVAADGKRFLMVKPVAANDAGTTLASVVVVQNWIEELKRLVPTRR